MHTLVRTYTFLKYAGTQLAEAKALVETGYYDDAQARVADFTVTIFKAIASALPAEKRELSDMNERELGKIISDLTFSDIDAAEIAAMIVTLRPAGSLSKSSDSALKLLSTAVRLHEMTSSLFPSRPDRLH